MEIHESSRKRAFNDWIFEDYSENSDNSDESNKQYLMDYEKFYYKFVDEMDQLSDEYELGIGKKRDILQDIWDKCGEVSDDSLEACIVNGQRFKEEIKKEMDTSGHVKKDTEGFKRLVAHAKYNRDSYEKGFGNYAFVEDLPF
nr:RNA-directed DNA polymerase, eukaryota, reverse transcriptase zinc-binding domain protein [Tanacetum cinerariifolium]